MIVDLATCLLDPCPSWLVKASWGWGGEGNMWMNLYGANLSSETRRFCLA